MVSVYQIYNSIACAPSIKKIVYIRDLIKYDASVEFRFKFIL